MQTLNSDFKRLLVMMDSEKKELRKIKNKRIFIWTIGITAIAAFLTIITIFSFMGGSSS